MSIALMNAAWRTGLPITRKMVLLALADQANDRGECYPSIPMIAERASLGERVIYEVLSDLVSGGYLRKECRTGRSTLYTVTDPCTWCTPAPGAPLHDVHPTPARDAGVPLHRVHPTPAPGAPITTKEPKSKSRSKTTALAPLALPEWLPADLWARWCTYRRKLNPKTWTPDAESLSVQRLAKFREEGHDPKTVIELAIVSGWRGLYPPKDEGTQARAGPAPPKGVRPDSVMSGVLMLERMKRELADDGNSDGVPEAEAAAAGQRALFRR